MHHPSACGSTDRPTAISTRPAAARDRRRLALLAFLFGALTIASASAAERDSGASLNLLLQAAIDEQWFFISRSNLASRNDQQELFLGFSGGALGYRISDSWSLRLGYRHAWIRPQQAWLEEDRLFAESYFADRFDGFRVSNRARVEFRFFDYRDDDVRLRNEITLEAPWRLTPLALHPYLEEEFFFSTGDGRFEANWLGGGLAWRPARGVKIKLGYRWNRFRVGEQWRDRDVVVAGLNLFF